MSQVLRLVASLGTVRTFLLAAAGFAFTQLGDNARNDEQNHSRENYLIIRPGENIERRG